MADVKRLMNPELKKWYGEKASIKQLTAISKPLHYCFELDEKGRGCVKTKMTAEQELWSEPFYPLKCENNALDAPDHKFKLKLEDIGMTIKEREVSYFRKT